MADCEHEENCTVTFWSSANSMRAQIVCSSCYSLRINQQNERNDKMIEMENQANLQQCFFCGNSAGLQLASGDIAACSSCIQNQRVQVEKAENIMVTNCLIEDGYD